MRSGGNKMTKMKYTIAVTVIGILMLLVLPAWGAAPTIDTTAPGLWLNSTDLNINIMGTNFPPDAANITVILSQTGQTNVSATGITTNSAANIIASFGVRSIHFGNWNLTVNNLSEGSNATKSNTLYVYNPLPTLSGITPSWAYNNSTAVPFTLTGTNFFPTPTVNLSAVSDHTNTTATILTQSSTTITGIFYLNGVPAGLQTVNLTNPDGNVTNTLPFTIYCPPPIITGVSPLNGYTDSAATLITISGSQFNTSTPGSTVTLLNGSTSIPINGPTFVVSSNTITFTANLVGQQVGLYNVTVNNNGPLYNNTTWTQPFQVFYPYAPIVSSVTPNTHINTSNTSVLIVGDKFQPGANVLLTRTGYSDINATSVVFNNVNNITCILTTNGTLAGDWYVKVVNNDTRSSNIDTKFTITPPPIPVASFNAAPVSGIAPLNVQFNDTSINNPAVWNWSFGDGQWYNTTVFANRNITHQYTIVGTYTAKLTVSNNSAGSTTQPGTLITVIKNDKIGLFRNGTVFLASNNTGGGGTINAFIYGQLGDLPVFGNWAGSGINTPGVYRNNMFYLRNTNTGGPANTAFIYGQGNDLPVAGHWTGVGSDTVGVFRNGTFFLASSNTPGGGAVNAFIFGQAGDLPVAGDWTGSGTTTIGVFRNGVWYLRNFNTGGIADTAFTYGVPGDKPVVGDWNGDGITEVGIFRNGLVALAGSNIEGGGTSNYFIYGQNGDLPVGGYWG